MILIIVIINTTIITLPSGQGLVLENGVYLTQTPGFRSAKQIFSSFVTWARARILSDCDIFCTLWGGRTMVGYNAPAAFHVRKAKEVTSRGLCFGDPPYPTF